MGTVAVSLVVLMVMAYSSTAGCWPPAQYYHPRCQPILKGVFVFCSRSLKVCLKLVRCDRKFMCVWKVWCDGKLEVWKKNFWTKQGLVHAKIRSLFEIVTEKLEVCVCKKVLM